MSANLFPINIDNLTPQERHQYFLNHYVTNRPLLESRRHKRDIDVIRENHRFLWEGAEEVEPEALSWEERLTLKYYRKLFKEYCIADLSRYQENKIALRWRTENEVVDGTGQFQCGSRRCSERESLRTWEVNFKYIENGAPNNALVKVRLCPTHSEQLNYRTKKREVKRQRRRAKEERRRKRRKLRRGEESSSDEAAEEEAKEESEAGPSEAEAEAEPETAATEPPPGGEEIWKQQPVLSKEKPSREQEFESYLEDLLL